MVVKHSLYINWYTSCPKTDTEHSFVKLTSTTNLSHMSLVILSRLQVQIKQFECKYSKPALFITIFKSQRKKNPILVGEKPYFHERPMSTPTQVLIARGLPEQLVFYFLYLPVKISNFKYVQILYFSLETF